MDRADQSTGAIRPGKRRVSRARDESAPFTPSRRTPSRACVHRHDGRVPDLPRRRGGPRQDVRVEDHRLRVRQGASRGARERRSRATPRGHLAILHHTRSSTRTPNASDARRGARVGRVFFGRAAYRASPETRRARHRVASSTREARHPAAIAKRPGNYHPLRSRNRRTKYHSKIGNRPPAFFLFLLATSRRG